MWSFRALAPLLVAALLGGGVAAGVGELSGGDSSVTTVVRELTPDGVPRREVKSSPTDNETIQQIYRDAAPGVVQVTSTLKVDDPFFGPQGQALGSGFVIDKAGHIVTNYHVVKGAKAIAVNFSGSDRFEATIVGVDPSTDIAVLKIDARVRALTPLPLGNSDGLEVGDAVVAIGNPFGLDRTVTAGIVSALQREIRAPNGYIIDKVVQTDAAINQGNSGGPLLDHEGKVIGVNSQIATADANSSGNVGIGFAVPINTVREVVAQLIEDGKAEHAYLGVRLATVDSRLSEHFRLAAEHGALVTEVTSGSPADKAGLQGGDSRVVLDGESYVLGGDIITVANRRKIATAEEFVGLVRGLKPGDKLTLEVQRKDEQLTITVTLGTWPSTLR